MNPTAEEILNEEPVAATEPVELEVEPLAEPAPEVEIEVIPDTEPVVIEKPFDEEKSNERIRKDKEDIESAPRSVQEKINTMTYHLRAVERQRDALHGDVEEYVKFAVGARTAAETLAKENAELRGHLKAVALAAREAQLELTQRDYQTAREGNDIAKESEISQRMAALQQERAQISQMAVPEAWVPPQPPARRYQVESTLSPETNNWLARNAWWNNPTTPVEAAAKALSISMSDQLEREGVAPSSEIHYPRIDDELRRRFPERFANTGAPTMTDPVKTQPAAIPARRPPVATAQRTNGAVNGSRKVVLTASQATKAKAEAALFGVPVEEYLKYKNMGGKQ